jgi:hypothetical protein
VAAAQAQVLMVLVLVRLENLQTKTKVSTH